MFKKAFVSILTVIVCTTYMLTPVSKAAKEDLTVNKLAKENSVETNITESSLVVDDFPENEFTMCAESPLFKLYVIGKGERTGEFYIKDNTSGAVFYSNPQDRDLSPAGLELTDQENSQFILNIYSENSGAMRKINSFSGTNNGKYVTVKIENGGFDAFYIVKNAVRLTLKLRLSEDGFIINTDVSKINNVKDNVITSIQVLPYFFASAYGVDGWSLVPDGSGALIYNNTDKDYATAYESRVYGNDLALSATVKATETEQIYLPVFGAKNTNGAFLAAIDTGAENAVIHANSSMDEGMYNMVYSSFLLVGSDKISIGEGVGEMSSDSEIYSVKNPLTKTIAIRYMLMSPDSDYADMAKLYRRHINLKTKGINPSPSAFIEVYGGLKRKESVYGMPLTIFKKMTNVSDAEKIVSYFADECGQPVVLSYRNADSELISGEIQNKFNFPLSLGGEKALKSLKEKCVNGLFIENNLFSAKKGGNGFSTFRDTAMRINRNKVLLIRYNLATTIKDKDKEPYYAVKASKIQNVFSKYLTSVKKDGYETAFIGLGSSLYSDFNSSGYISRAECAQIFSALLKSYGKNGLLYSPNAYALAYGRYIADTPTSSSKYDIIDVDIPFYQLVLSGVKEYSTKSINLEADINDSFLSALESGASLKFTFVYDQITSVKNTDYDYLYGADFSSRKKQCMEYQKKLSEAYESIGSRVIINHSVLKSGIRVAEFDNGSKVVINRTGEEIETEYGKVPVGGYIVVK